MSLLSCHLFFSSSLAFLRLSHLSPPPPPPPPPPPSSPSSPPSPPLPLPPPPFYFSTQLSVPEAAIFKVGKFQEHPDIPDCLSEDAKNLLLGLVACVAV